jgi:hypothetical protein
MSEDSHNQIKGQALFLRALAYYELATYYQTLPLITDYASYSTITGLYASSNTQDEVFDQIETDPPQQCKCCHRAIKVANGRKAVLQVVLLLAIWPVH